MIRFVDLRRQVDGRRFAFWDTVTDTFECYNTEQAWADWRDFEEDWRAENSPFPDLERYRILCPPWVFEPPADEELGY